MSGVMVLNAYALADIWNHLLEYEEIFYTTLRMLAVIAMTQFMNWSQDHLLEEQYDIENPAEQTKEEVSADGSADGVVDADSVAYGAVDGVTDSSADGSSDGSADDSSDGVEDGSALDAAGSAANGATPPRAPNNCHGRRRNLKRRTFAPDQELNNQQADIFQLHFPRPRTRTTFCGRQRFM